VNHLCIFTSDSHKSNKPCNRIGYKSRKDWIHFKDNKIEEKLCLTRLLHDNNGVVELLPLQERMHVA
jgi:hypothetical protein